MEHGLDLFIHVSLTGILINSDKCKVLKTSVCFGIRQH